MLRKRLWYDGKVRACHVCIVEGRSRRQKLFSQVKLCQQVTESPQIGKVIREFNAHVDLPLQDLWHGNSAELAQARTLNTCRDPHECDGRYFTDIQDNHNPEVSNSQKFIKRRSENSEALL